VLVATLALTLSSAGPVQAAYDDSPIGAWEPNGAVLALAEHGGRVYVGGSFTSWRNIVTGTVVARTRLAALDAATGAPIAGWTPTAGGAVKALAVSPDGQTLYVGGEFGQINGSAQSRLAAITTASGALVPGWRASTGGAVNAIVATGDRVIVGGSFGAINGVSRLRLGAVNPANGLVIASWIAHADHNVFALTAGGAGGSVLVGGRFRSLDGAPRDYLGAVDPVTGNVTAWQPPPRCIDSNPCLVFSLAVGAGRVYAAVAGPGGQGAAYDLVTGELRWHVDADGDVQAAAYSDGNVYFGGHFAPIFAGTDRTMLAAVNASTGALLPFAPTLETAYPGVQAMLATPSVLRVGGSFTNAGGTGLDRLAGYPVETAAPPLVAAGSQWAYVDDGSDQGTAWRAPGFDDVTWARGNAQLGFGDGDETTVLRNRQITYYFRHAFDVTDPAAFTELRMRLVRDDGAVVYLNGVEVVRTNMPAGEVTSETPASSTLSGPEESAWNEFGLAASGLVAGRNVISVEIHNSSRSSSDVSFDLELVGLP
jgi:hypothetical protein